MQFHPTPIRDLWLIELESIRDDRGSFTRNWCSDEFARQGLSTSISQCGISFNAKAGTWRGMHYQEKPHAEEKLVRVSRGAIMDVVFDFRGESESDGATYQVELSDSNQRMLYIPTGCAHGFLTLVDATEVNYQMSALYYPDSAKGLRFDDPVLKIDWPMAPKVMSDRDRGFPDFELETVTR